MERTLTIVNQKAEITFSDLDSDLDMEISIEHPHYDDRYIYLSKENIISLRKHLDYLLQKF
jgi:hypothetical protein